MKLFITVMGVLVLAGCGRIERAWTGWIQDISKDDARAKGVNTNDEFQALWQSIHGDDPRRSWDANPLVLAIEFERVKS